MRASLIGSEADPAVSWMLWCRELMVKTLQPRHQILGMFHFVAVCWVWTQSSWVFFFWIFLKAINVHVSLYMWLNKTQNIWSQGKATGYQTPDLVPVIVDVGISLLGRENLCFESCLVPGAASTPCSLWRVHPHSAGLEERQLFIFAQTSPLQAAQFSS